MKKSLSKKEHLRGRKDLKAVFSSPLRESCQGIRLIYRENGLKWSRFAISVTKKYGNAVKRNRAKRIVREIYRNMKERIKPGFDMVFVLYPGEYLYGKREEQIITLLESSELLIAPSG